jgi:hypothetical protein
MDRQTQITLKALFDAVGSLQAQMDIFAAAIGMVDPKAAQEGQQVVEQKKRELEEAFQKQAMGEPVPVPPGEMVEVEGMDVAATLQTILAAQVHQKRYCESLTAKDAQQDATIAAQDAKITVLVQLVDSHQRTFDLAKASAMQQGPVN